MLAGFLSGCSASWEHEKAIRCPRPSAYRKGFELGKVVRTSAFPVTRVFRVPYYDSLEDIRTGGLHVREQALTILLFIMVLICVGLSLEPASIAAPSESFVA